MAELPVCENCNQRNSLLYALFPNLKGYPYLQVCKVCVADIATCANNLKEMCDKDYPWTGEVYDGGHELWWSEGAGQLFNPSAAEAQSS